MQGRMVSLDHIEHDILRVKFKDPRIHVAINCASKSCPPLLNEPYEGQTLEDQLDQQAKNFINSGKYNFLKGDTLFISMIFKWFKEDFSDQPLLFIRQYASTDLKKSLGTQSGDIKINYLEYNWALNR
jgi:hypothetical protein